MINILIIGLIIVGCIINAYHSFQERGEESLITSIFLIACIIGACFFLGVNTRHLIIGVISYLAIVCLWTPTFWYLYLRRVASDAKKEKSKYTTIEEWERGTKLYPEIKFIKDKTTNRLKAEIQNPKKDILIAQAIGAPITMPIYLSRQWVIIIIDVLIFFMDKIRKQLSETI